MSRQHEEESDDQLDAMLRTHLTSRLDAQLGRARRAFEAHLAESRPQQGTASAVRSRFWVIGVVGTALAASIAALWAVPIVWPGATTPLAKHTTDVPQPLPPVLPRATTSSRTAAVQAGTGWEQVGSVVSCISHDKGVVLIGNDTPARVVQQFETERMQFVCPTRGVRVEIEVPRQTTNLIPLDTH
jgi:hypothetical protein